MPAKHNKKHLTLTSRIKIESGILNNHSITHIARDIPANTSTVYREIIRNRTYHKAKSLKCIYLAECLKRRKKSEALECSKCKNFKEAECEKLSRYPFVCNGCDKSRYCMYSKFFYKADEAQRHSDKVLKVSRSGIRIAKENFVAIDSIISPLIRQKQSLNHILSTHDEINVSERTLRNWINAGYTHAKTIDMPRVVRFKVKKEYNYRNSKPVSILKDRTFIDYKNYIRNHPNLIVSQFDTVHGLISDKKRVLTIHFPSIEFQIGLLLNNGTSEEVTRVLNELKVKIGIDKWKEIFPIILTDNGVEFNDLIDFENDNNEKVSSVFFADPYRSGQKGSCERNHELFRYIQPKKQSIEYLTEDILNTYFSHINCYYRNSLPGVRPYDLAVATFGKDVVDSLGIIEIKPDEVTFDKTKLLKK